MLCKVTLGVFKAPFKLNVLFNIKLKLFKIGETIPNGNRLKNSFRWQRLEVTLIQSRTFCQIPSGDSRPTNCQVVSYGRQDYNVLC